jgi:hypothetical protein
MLFTEMRKLMLANKFNVMDTSAGFLYAHFFKAKPPSATLAFLLHNLLPTVVARPAMIRPLPTILCSDTVGMGRYTDATTS